VCIISKTYRYLSYGAEIYLHCRRRTSIGVEGIVLPGPLIKDICPNVRCRKVGILHGNLLRKSKDVIRSSDEILEYNYLNGFARDGSMAKSTRV